MAKGGARNGAGRPGYKVKGEKLLRFDIRAIHRRGLLWVGGTNTWSWSRCGEHAGSVRFTVNSSSIYLAYSVKGKEASQHIETTTTPCAFGGSRTWFGCPACHRRAAVLYMRSGGFACRSCQRVSYSTQSGTNHDRVCNLYHRLADKLEAGKPKWQRWATYNRQEEKFERISEQFDASLYGRLQSLGFV